MRSGETPVWPLPVLALAQLLVAVPVMPLRENGGPWDVGYAALAATFGVVGLAIAFLAVRNCARLWRLGPARPSWSLTASLAAVAVCSSLWATGPMTVGAWHWWSLAPAALAVHVGVVLVRTWPPRHAAGRSSQPPAGRLPVR